MPILTVGERVGGGGKGGIEEQICLLLNVLAACNVPASFENVVSLAAYSSNHWLQLV